MAKPQPEDGHVDIANELAEALCRINLSAYETRVLWALWRKTYGWHKKADHISYTQFEQLTGLKRWHIARTIKRLKQRNIVTSKGNGYRIEYSFQKDYERWEGIMEKPKSLPNEVTLPLPIQVTSVANEALPIQDEALPIQVAPLPKKVTNSLPKEVNTKEKKETIQKKLYKRKYGEFNNVLLTDKEYQKLEDKFGTGVFDKIEALSGGIESKGYKYQSHYAAILCWDRRDKKEKETDHGAHQRNPRKIPAPGEYTNPSNL